MTISEFTLTTNDEEPVRRFEVFTGSGRRREWSEEEKARIVAESYEPGASVSDVARHHALSPELWRNLGDDGLKRAAYRGGCRACQNLSTRAIRHE